MTMHNLEKYKNAIIQVFPELESSNFSMLPPGGHSDAIDADDVWVFKFPRNEEALQALKTEIRILTAIRSGLTMSVPEISLHQSSLIFSKHRKLNGVQLLTDVYSGLSNSERDQIADSLALFYTQIHALDRESMKSLGVSEVPSWGITDETRNSIKHLPVDLQAFAEKELHRYERLPPDPQGSVYGFFDGHGWNMAFDLKKKVLNGIYDFADSGFGPLHREFTYSNFISPDLTLRLVNRYEEMTSLKLDRDRIEILTSFHRIDEFAGAFKAQQEVSQTISVLRAWAKR